MSLWPTLSSIRLNTSTHPFMQPSLTCKRRMTASTSLSCSAKWSCAAWVPNFVNWWNICTSKHHHVSKSGPNSDNPSPQTLASDRGIPYPHSSTTGLYLPSSLAMISATSPHHCKGSETPSTLLSNTVRQTNSPSTFPNRATQHTTHQTPTTSPSSLRVKHSHMKQTPVTWDYATQDPNTTLTPSCLRRPPELPLPYRPC